MPAMVKTCRLEEDLDSQAYLLDDTCTLHGSFKQTGPRSGIYGQSHGFLMLSQSNRALIVELERFFIGFADLAAFPAASPR